MDYLQVKRFFRILENAYPAVHKKYGQPEFIGGYAYVGIENPCSDTLPRLIEMRTIGEPAEQNRSTLSYWCETAAHWLNEKTDPALAFEGGKTDSSHLKADGAAIRAPQRLIFSMTGLPYRVCLAALAAAMIQAQYITETQALELMAAHNSLDEFKGVQFIIRYNNSSVV